MAAGPAPATCPRPAGALAPGVARAAGRVTLVALAVVSLVQPPRPIFLVRVLVSQARGGLGGGQLDFPGTLDCLLGQAEMVGVAGGSSRLCPIPWGTLGNPGALWSLWALTSKL